jgi:carbamoyltransferase
MKIAGFCSGHDCSYAILENGIPIIHNELERFTREKEPIGDSIQFMFDTYEQSDDIKHFTHCQDSWNGGIQKRYPESFQRINSIVEKNNGEYFIPGHHQSHAANAFFSSNYEKALIITIDGGGRDFDSNGNEIISAFTVWEGEGTKIQPITILPDSSLNIGWKWLDCTGKIFGLSTGHPRGNQAGTVMAMASIGNPEMHFEPFYHYLKRDSNLQLNFGIFQEIAEKSEQDKFDIAASLQKATEHVIYDLIKPYIDAYEHDMLCLSGGVVLNSVTMGKIFEWFPKIKNVYICPVPYDAGLAIGSAQYVWHHILNNPRIQWNDSCTPYLGKIYSFEEIKQDLDKFDNSIVIQHDVDIDMLVDLFIDPIGNVISLFNNGSESGRRALGNRSIIADARNTNMKQIINDKVKHRQWYRPFAPSILREDVSNWFVRDLDSPYMSFVIPFKEEVKHLVPAVVHLDGTGRLQTVTEQDNPWYYRFIKKVKEKTNIPLILNTSFNDREPIVETPEHAIACFLGTNIDYLYFCQYNILIRKK